jgi:hypothetical protein
VRRRCGEDHYIKMKEKAHSNMIKEMGSRVTDLQEDSRWMHGRRTVGTRTTRRPAMNGGDDGRRMAGTTG